LFNPTEFIEKVRTFGFSLGFSQIGFTKADISSSEPAFLSWLAKGFHGEMEFMSKHGTKRTRPDQLVPGTLSIVSASMNYLPNSAQNWAENEWKALKQSDQGVISVYARGRDYHKVLRQRLQHLANFMQSELNPLGYRVFTDSAPVMEVELAKQAGLGWRGKNTLLLNRHQGSMFFLGEIYLNMDLRPSKPEPTTESHCGSCTACIDVCPTKAFIEPYLLDARRCISYLTIEHPGSIETALRPLMGNRIYGCDDCQLICPWNKFAQFTSLADFEAKPHLTPQSLLSFWSWSEEEFLTYTQGTPIRRIGHERWLRNLCVALGNALRDNTLSPQLHQDIRVALNDRSTHPSHLVREHLSWALQQRASD
jgi:epoxyqueuosine reductase